MNMRILRALLRKEFKMMRSNPLVPKVIIGMPLMVMLVLPLVANLDVKRVAVAVVDDDHTRLSARVVADLDAPAEIDVVGMPQTPAEAMSMMERGEADVVLTLPRHFERSGGDGYDIQANGVNATKGLLGAQYVGASVGQTIAEHHAGEGRSVEVASPAVLNLYNPTLDFRNYMVPALMVVILIMICGFLPTLNLVSEVETGTIEAINVTPVGKFTFILSKLLPFWVVAMLVITEGILIGRLVYGLTPQGSVWAIYLASLLFSLVMSGIGVAVANRSSTILQSIFVMMALVIIFQLMGGLFTPIGSMPVWAQTLTYVVPPRYFNEIMRAIYLKGTPVAELWQPFCMLALLAVGAYLLAAATYRKRS